MHTFTNLHFSLILSMSAARFALLRLFFWLLRLTRKNLYTCLQAASTTTAVPTFTTNPGTASKCRLTQLTRNIVASLT